MIEWVVPESVLTVSELSRGEERSYSKVYTRAVCTAVRARYRTSADLVLNAHEISGCVGLLCRRIRILFFRVEL